MSKKQNNDSFVSAKLFVGALLIIAALMVASYIATLFVPCEGIPFWKFLLSPVLVLTAEGNVTIIGVLVFLLIIGGVFNTLEKADILVYLLNKIAARFGDSKYKLMAVIMFFFMALGSLIGSFEECVPMVPIVVALAVRLGWDRLTGMSMSLLSVGCGFAAGVFNPFTVGIVQDLAGLPMFSGAWFRVINFVCIYTLLFLFTRAHAKKVDRGIASVNEEKFEHDKRKERGVTAFAIIIIAGIVIVMSSAFLTFLRDWTFIIVGVMFLIAGIVACAISGMKSKSFCYFFGKGLVSMLPAVLMILMASSIGYILKEAKMLEVIINASISAAESMPGWSIILFIYLIVLVMNFFIASGSAKAFMLTPLLIPLAEPFGISAQLVVVAFAFGDGFSNVFYPTNPALLISLGLADTSYVDWFKWSGKFQLLNILLTSGLLLLGKAIGV